MSLCLYLKCDNVNAIIYKTDRVWIIFIPFISFKIAKCTNEYRDERLNSLIREVSRTYRVSVFADLSRKLSNEYILCHYLKIRNFCIDDHRDNIVALLYSFICYFRSIYYECYVCYCLLILCSFSSLVV